MSEPRPASPDGRGGPAAERAAPGRGGRRRVRRHRTESTLARLLGSAAGRNLGLVVALLILVIVGIATGGERFASVDNLLTILRLASTIGVVSIGMTFVITGGGIDLSVGAIVALASVWATTLATQTMAENNHWILMVFAALAVGAGCGLVNGRADRLRPDRTVHRHARHAGGGPRTGRDHREAEDPDRRRERVPRLLRRASRSASRCS